MDAPAPIPAWIKLAAGTLILALLVTMLVVALTQDNTVARSTKVERAPRMVEPADS